MRFSTLLLAALAITSTHATQSLTQLLSSSYIVDMTTVDINTNTTMQSWRQYQSVATDINKVQTTVMTKQWNMQPFNQTITLEQAQLSGTGGSSMDGPIYDYSATAWAQSLNGPRTWTSCNSTMLSSRQPDYCTEIYNSTQLPITCGRNMTQTCTVSEVQCRHNSVILPSMFYMLDAMTGMIVASMESKNATQVTFWSNLIDKPTSGQFGDAVLLPARASCPDNNAKFPVTFGNAPVMPSSASSSSSSASSSSAGSSMPSSSSSSTGGGVISDATPAPTASSSTGPFIPRSSSSTGAIQFGAASSSIPALSAIIMLLPAVMTAFLRV